MTPAAAPPPAVAQLPPGDSGGPRNEVLLMLAPEGMKVGASGRPAPRQQMMEFVPAAESVTDWTRMVTQHVAYGLSNVDPDRLPAEVGRRWTAGCPGGSAEKTAAGPQNGYPASLWTFRCPLNAQTGKPESMVMKTIGGADSLYDVQYAFRAELTPARVAEAAAYLKSVTVCDTRRPEHPCPVLRPPGPSAPPPSPGR